jgi:hypothetical protein
MTTTTTTTIQGVVGSRCDDCNLLSLLFFCSYLLCGTGRELQGLSMDDEEL